MISVAFICVISLLNTFTVFRTSLQNQNSRQITAAIYIILLIRDSFLSVVLLVFTGIHG